MISSRKEIPTRKQAANQRGHHSICETNGTLAATPATIPIPPIRETGRWCRDRSFGWSSTLSDKVRSTMANTINVEANETKGITYGGIEEDDETIDHDLLQ